MFLVIDSKPHFAMRVKPSAPLQKQSHCMTPSKDIYKVFCAMVKDQVSFVQDPICFCESSMGHHPQPLEVSRPRWAPLQRHRRCSPHMTSTFEAEIGQLGRFLGSETAHFWGDGEFWAIPMEMVRNTSVFLMVITCYKWSCHSINKCSGHNCIHRVPPDKVLLLISFKYVFNFNLNMGDISWSKRMNESVDAPIRS